MNLVVSNVPGPPVPLYLAGARVLEMFPMMPPMGNLTLVVAALSYAGQLNLTAAADRDSCPDVEVFTQGVHDALDELGRNVLHAAPFDATADFVQLIADSITSDDLGLACGESLPDPLLRHGVRHRYRWSRRTG